MGYASGRRHEGGSFRRGMVKGNKLTERHCKLRDGFGPAGKERDADETKTDIIGFIFAAVYLARDLIFCLLKRTSLRALSAPIITPLNFGPSAEIISGR